MPPRGKGKDTAARFDCGSGSRYVSRMCALSGRSGVRHVFVLLMLVANVLAAGTPLLHAAAHTGHDRGHEHHDAVVAQEQADHGHGEVHAPSLHDDGALVKKAAPDLLFVALATPVSLDLSGQERTVAFHPVPRLPSRAPPPGDPARAPPLA